MKIIKIKLTNFRNNEHLMFCIDFNTLVIDLNPETLGIKPQFDIFEGLLNMEGNAMKKVTKSPITAQINLADRDRDSIFRGMADANRSAVRHYKPSVREAAGRLQIVFDAYGNVAKEAVAEQTASIASLINELTMKHSEDVETVGLAEWIEELGSRNKTVAKLMHDRYEETAQQTAPSLRIIRKQIDEVYREITERIDALMLVNGSEVHEAFIRMLNAIIDRANAVLAARRGRSGNSTANAEPDAASE